ncbi:MAG TPA: TetR/AcrR family transcriptional regulator [Geothrix sp.]|nr:TetR/AcrR family transcriptional regulator [Geothrix sp.]
MADRPYHHGNLKQALVTAAMAAVEKDGVEHVSLRELSARLGVSRMAAYRHFADKEDLLASVAALGFDMLCDRYEAALAGPGDGRARLRAVVRACFDMGAKRPGLYRLMFASDFLKRHLPPAVLAAPAARAYALLRKAVDGAYPEVDERRAKAATMVLLSLCQGYLTLRAAGRFKPFMVEPMTFEEGEAAVLDAAVSCGESWPH